MNSRERFDFYVKNGIRKPDDDIAIITNLVNRLIDNLYVPQEGDSPFITDRTKIESYGMDGEPINWGDLKCCEVKKVDGGVYQIIIDEASPNACPNLCAYIEKFMCSWGWGCVAYTEW